MKIIDGIRKNKLGFGVFTTYVILFIFTPKEAMNSVNNTSYYLIEMIKILPVVFVLTSLIETWVPKDIIINGLGKKAGFKGVILSFLLGSLSAGPIYAAFPVCKMLLKKGASIGNIVIILSAWAVIKVPMLANEVQFLGIQFMAVRWILTVLSIVVIALIMEKIVKKDYLPFTIIDAHTTEPSQIVGITINDNYCIGCGLCEKIQPANFKLIDKKASWIEAEINDDAISLYKQTIEKCPAKVIQFKYVNVASCDDSNISIKNSS